MISAPSNLSELYDLTRERRAFAMTTLLVYVIEIKAGKVSGSRSRSRYHYLACAHKYPDGCCRRRVGGSISSRSTPNRNISHICGAAGSYEEWHFYVKLGDPSVRACSADSFPRCVVFQEGDQWIGMKANMFSLFPHQEKVEALTRDLKGVWNITLELNMDYRAANPELIVWKVAVKVFWVLAESADTILQTIYDNNILPLQRSGLYGAGGVRRRKTEVMEELRTSSLPVVPAGRDDVVAASNGDNVKPTLIKTPTNTVDLLRPCRRYTPASELKGHENESLMKLSCQQSPPVASDLG
ncbi:hypothetical protein R1sor_021161 [Riccia sorocarpa]|uniref:Uncharacterized protein n=1 Tax=Riccia sorocarpa TaxID=122646 RepID=A0ABD3GJM5_9MARC